MLDRIRAMPGGIRLFLAYALLILVGIGLSLRSVVDQARSRRRSARGGRRDGPARLHDLHDDARPPAQAGGPRLALGLASLTIPLVLLLALSRLHRRGRLRRGARPAAVPRPAPPGGPDVPERAVSAASGRSAARPGPGRYPLRQRVARVAAGTRPRPGDPSTAHEAPREQGDPPASAPGNSRRASRPRRDRRRRPVGAGVDRPRVGGRHRGRPRPVRTGQRPTPDPSRHRPATGSTAARQAAASASARPYKPSFLERYRTAHRRGGRGRRRRLVVGVRLRRGVAAGVRLLDHLDARPTASPAAERHASLGYVQPDMGNSHVARRRQGRRTPTARRRRAATTTPPAPGRSPPASTARTTRSSRRAGSTTSSTAAWSSCTRATATGATPDGQAAGVRTTPSRRARSAASRRAQSRGPVIARFDDMAWPFAALVWDRVLPLETLDEAEVLDFWHAVGRADEPGEALPDAEPSRRRAVSTAPRRVGGLEPASAARVRQPDRRAERRAAPSPS